MYFNCKFCDKPFTAETSLKRHINKNICELVPNEFNYKMNRVGPPVKYSYHCVLIDGKHQENNIIDETFEDQYLMISKLQPFGYSEPMIRRIMNGFRPKTFCKSSLLIIDKIPTTVIIKDSFNNINTPIPGVKMEKIATMQAPKAAPVQSVVVQSPSGPQIIQVPQPVQPIIQPVTQIEVIKQVQKQAVEKEQANQVKRELKEAEQVIEEQEEQIEELTDDQFEEQIKKELEEEQLEELTREEEIQAEIEADLRPEEPTVDFRILSRVAFQRRKYQSVRIPSR